MIRVLSPLCLILALAMLVTGFALLAVGSPQESVQLHRARVIGDEAYTEVLEDHLERRQLTRKVLLGCLFGGSALMTIVAFGMMRPHCVSGRGHVDT